MIYKGLRIHRATLDSQIDNLSTEVLIQKFVGMMFDGSMDQANGIQEMREIGIKIYERLPESLSAAKVALIGFILENKLNETDRLSFEKILAQAQERFPDNWDLYEVSLMNRKSRSEKEYQAAVKTFYQTYPDSALAAYHLGCVFWTKTDLPAAQKYLKLAYDREPTNKRFQESWTQSQKLPAQERVCSLQIGFDPSNF
jgi:TolA-binding protein